MNEEQHKGWVRRKVKVKWMQIEVITKCCHACWCVTFLQSLPLLHTTAAAKTQPFNIITLPKGDKEHAKSHLIKKKTFMLLIKSQYSFLSGIDGYHDKI